jgi:NhaP-type Na+/H+ or K+/H+ antiporter
MSAMAPALLATSTPAVRDLAIVAVVLLAFALVSKRLHGTPVTPAIVFVLTGLVLGSEGLDLIGSAVEPALVKLLAEVTLALVLFTDAASIRVRLLRRESGLPTRLLLVGLPLTIAAGTLVGLPLFPGLGLFEVVILAIVLAPTDAALGEAVVSDQRIPSRVRQGLNVESGLNDGICVPLLFAAIALAELEEGSTFEGRGLVDLVKEVAIATTVGVAVALAAASLLRASSRRGWVQGRWLQVVPLATATIAYTATTDLGGSGFVATFAGGLMYRAVLGGEDAEQSVRLTEELGGLLSAVTFFVFGAVVVGESITDLDVRTVLYAVLSLTVIRMIPVAVALGRGPGLPTVAFAGWFGPRGLASIVFALIIVEGADLPGTALLVQVAMVTVLLSVFAHGLSAPWLTQRYAAWVETRAGAPPT